MRKLLALVVVSLACSLALGQYAGSAAVAPDHQIGFAAIRESNLREWLGYLAGPECEGRGTGQPGYQKAADYVAARFKEWGLKPAGNGGSYFQDVPFVRFRASSRSYMQIDSGDTVPVVFNSVTADSEALGDLVIISANGAGASLSEGTDLSGKVVVLAGSPSRNIRRQVSAGRPAAIITIAQKEPSVVWTVRRVDSNPRPQSTVTATMGMASAKQLFTKVGASTNLLTPDFDGAQIVTPASRISISVKVEKEDIGVPNVAGMIEGSDPTLKSEVVALGSHLDHLGTNGVDVFYGADDDGSGTTSLLAVAHAFSKSPNKPKRSILFLAFCGEEMGLVGSRYFVEHPTVPLDKIVCLLQMDMVGRNEESQEEKAEDNIQTLHLIGSKRISMDLHEMVLNANKSVGFVFEYDEEDVYTRSDHYVFAEKGIPISFVFSGFHPDYHAATDLVEKINFTKIANTARLNFLAAYMVADRAERLRKDAKPPG